MTPMLVLDCSITMAWCFPDEATPQTEAIEARLITEAAIVPAHWFLEVSNVLALAEKRKRITPAETRLFLDDLSKFDVQVDEDTHLRAFDEILPLARQYGLTTYDAAYLELANRRRLPLASLDEPLRRAVTSLGLPVLGT